jgi:hypothetical protein
VKRKILIVALALATIMPIVFSSFGTASARVIATLADHIDAYGSTVIDVTGHPKVVVDGYHLDYGDLGSGDVIRISSYVDTPVFGQMCVAKAIFTDIPQRANFLQQFYEPNPTSIQLLDPSDIRVTREGKSKTIMIVWKEALQVPEENWYEASAPAFTLPAGRLIFRGHGEAASYSASISGSSGWFQTATWTGYYGDATFVCPAWHFGGPVGESEGDYRTNIHTDMTVVSNQIIVSGDVVE